MPLATSLTVQPFVGAPPPAAIVHAALTQETVERRRAEPSPAARSRLCTESMSELGFLMLIAFLLEDALAARYGAGGAFEAQQALMMDDAALDAFDFGPAPADAPAASVQDARSVGVVYDLADEPAVVGDDMAFAFADDAGPDAWLATDDGWMM